MASIERFYDQLPHPDRITVTRTVEGTQDPDTGIYTPGGSTTVLTCPCDVQEDRYKRFRDRVGDAFGTADAVCYLPSAAPLKDVRPDDRAIVEQDEMVRPARIVEVLYFEHAMTLAFL